MAFKKNDSDEIKYTVGDIDEVIDNKGNSVILLRKMTWNNGKEKLELRRWIVDINEEKPLKGVAFLTDDGPDNLVNVLVDKGYGKTHEVLQVLKRRDDFEEALENLNKKPNAKKSSKYLDPKEMLSD
jgi:hypothetical protein